jgi:uncharacterized protein YcsI (UPF0317 family)
VDRLAAPEGRSNLLYAANSLSAQPQRYSKQTRGSLWTCNTAQPQMSASSTESGAQVRRLCRENRLPSYPSTAGLARGHIQANVVVLPAKYASDFRSLCQRNPVPCPLIGETPVGDPNTVIPLREMGFAHKIFHESVDVRTDLPKYNVYRRGKFVGSADDIKEYWKDDSIAFVIGCSYSFETALVDAGLPPRHHLTTTTVPMYRTTQRLNPAGIFTRGTVVVSMRPYPASEIETVRKITASYQMTWTWGTHCVGLGRRGTTWHSGYRCP